MKKKGQATRYSCEWPECSTEAFEATPDLIAMLNGWPEHWIKYAEWGTISKKDYCPEHKDKATRGPRERQLTPAKNLPPPPKD